MKEILEKSRLKSFLMPYCKGRKPSYRWPEAQPCLFCKKAEDPPF